jgi:hypothetical protein
MARKLLYLAGVTATAVAVGACATMRVSSHVERGRDFSQYRTFDWGPADALPTSDPRLGTDPFFKDQVEGAIEKQMAARGFTLSPVSETPDVRIHYHASINRRIDVDQADGRYGYSNDDSGGARVIEYEAGTLVVDIVDARTNTLIWRGWAQKSVEGVLGNRDRLKDQLEEGVTRMFVRLPQAR